VEVCLDPPFAPIAERRSLRGLIATLIGGGFLVYAAVAVIRGTLYRVIYLGRRLAVADCRHHRPSPRALTSDRCPERPTRAQLLCG
jgi:hypothetical protein